MNFRKSLLLAFVSSSLLLLTTVEARTKLHFDRRTAAAGDVDTAADSGSGKLTPLEFYRRSNGEPRIIEYVPPSPAPGFRKREFGDGGELVKRDQSSPLVPESPGYKAPAPISGRGGGKPPVLKRSPADAGDDAPPGKTLGAVPGHDAGTGTGADNDGNGIPDRIDAATDHSFYWDRTAIYFTSSLSAVAPSSKVSGYFGVCRCARGPDDGVRGTERESCTTRFFKEAGKTAECEYHTATDISCTEQGGKLDMTDGDNTWWQQAFCKRCIDVGGVSAPEYSCPEGYTPDGKGKIVGKLGKDGVKTGPSSPQPKRGDTKPVLGGVV